MTEKNPLLMPLAKEILPIVIAARGHAAVEDVCTNVLLAHRYAYELLDLAARIEDGWTEETSRRLLHALRESVCPSPMGERRASSAPSAPA